LSKLPTLDREVYTLSLQGTKIGGKGIYDLETAGHKQYHSFSTSIVFQLSLKK